MSGPLDNLALDHVRCYVDDLDAHGSGDADGFAVDDPHGVGRRFIGVRRGARD